MKNQSLFSSKDKSKKLKCFLLQLLFGTLRVNLSQLDLHCLSSTLLVLSMVYFTQNVFSEFCRTNFVVCFVLLLRC